MKEVRYSIITVTRNSEATLEETIKSIRTAKDCYAEYIVVDGDSTDKTKEIIRSNDDIVDTFLELPAIGIYPSINAAIKISKGELIILVHSDDILYENVLPEIYKLYIKKKSKEFFTIGTVDIVDNQSRFLSKKMIMKDFNKESVYLKRMPVPHFSCVISRKAYERVGLYREDLRAASDYDLVIQLLKHKIPYSILDFTVGAYRIGGLSSQLWTAKEAHIVRISNGQNYIISLFYLIISIVRSTIYKKIRDSQFFEFLYPENFVLYLIDNINLDGGAQVLLKDLSLKSKENNFVFFLNNSNQNSLTKFNEFTKTRKINLLILFFTSLLLKFRNKKFKVVHTHLTKSFYCAFLIPSLKIIHTEHNSWNKRRKFFLTRFLDRFLYLQYSTVVCISNGVRHSLNKYLGTLANKCRSVVIYNWASNIFEIQRPEVYGLIDKRLSKIRNGRFKGVMIGSFTSQKRQIELIDLIEKKNFLEFTFIGEGQSRLKVETEVKNRGLDNRIFFTGAISSEEVVHILRESDLYLHAVAWEGFGISILEAMKLGLPILASNVEGLSEVIQNNEMLIESFQSQKASHLITKLYEDNSYYLAASKNSYEKSRKFDINKSIKLYDKLYSS